MDGAPNLGGRSRGSDFRIEIEKGIEALLELGFDLFARALEHVHGDVCLVSIGELEGGVVDFDDFAFGEEAHSIDKSQICHVEHLIGIRDQETGAGVKIKERGMEQ